MEKHTLQDLCNIHSYLSQIKKQSEGIKKAIANLEKRICEQIEGMRLLGPMP